ncbi:MAG TPA: DNA primase [Candidatus Saccharimonadales bacterium]|nr:DNA primase [Candidatus Saccharimonadales bacterium]
MDLFNFIKQNVDITSVIGEYTSLKKAGSLYWKGRCPFHHENTPSFSVSPHKNIFYCFGCHENGDVINFIEKIEHLSALQAAQHLAQRFNLEIPQDIQNGMSHQAIDKNHYRLCQIVAQWCNSMLLKSPQALSYLKKRNISSFTCSQFVLGFFPSGKRGVQQLLEYIAHQGFSSTDLIEQHIIFKGNHGLYSPFEDRIIFPIKDHLGQTCGFGGRIFLPHDNRPKYYNSMETQQFKKGKLLFGFDLAKQEIHKQKTTFLVEGYTDCIAMHQHGYKNVVATLGTACSTDHLLQLAKHAQTIYLLYDADSAGKQAILRLTSSCWQLDLDLKVITLPIGQDPASLLEQGQSLAPYVTSAHDIFSFFLQARGNSFGQESMKNQMSTIQELFELIAQVQDSLKQNILLMKTAETLQIPLEIIKKEYNNRYRGPQKNTQAQKNTQDSAKVGYRLVKESPEKASSDNKPEIITQDKLEQQIIAAIIHDPTVLSQQYETLLIACLSPSALKIVEKIINYRKVHNNLNIQNLSNVLNAQELEQTKSLLFSIESANIHLTFENLMLQFQKKYWKSIASHIKMKIVQAKRDNDTDEIQRLMDVFENLKLELCKKGRL